MTFETVVHEDRAHFELEKSQIVRRRFFVGGEARDRREEERQKGA
jgi:hypothetical protein